VGALGHAGESAADGREALAAIEKRAFDVVLMDVHMRGLSGPETARRMRRTHGSTARPRILGLTGTAEAADREACRSAGMEALLLKPIDPGTLRAALEPQVEPASSELLDARIHPGQGSARASAERPALGEFLKLFAADTPRQMARLRQAAQRWDAAELAQTAHRLAGSSSTVGAKLLGTLAAKLEALARAGDAPGSTALLADLERAWPATREALACARSRDAAAPTS
jgi:CheY-like chemotaxis protein